MRDLYDVPSWDLLRFASSLLLSQFSIDSRCRVDCVIFNSLDFISSVQLFSRVQLFATPWIAARQASLSITSSGVHSDSRPSSPWCHPAISSSVVPFSSCPQSLPASESFPMSQLFSWGGQSTGVSALASFLPKNPRADLLQNGLVGSPCSPRDSQESSPTL